MNKWQKQIPGCFGERDAFFANHPCDKERAKSMYYLALHESVCMDEILEQLKIYLLSINACKEHIGQQLEEAEKLFKKWKPRQIMKYAWLITWEGSKTPININEKIVAIKSRRVSSAVIRSFVEDYYLSKEFSIIEQMFYANRRKDNPYLARFEMQNGRFVNKIRCGNDPYLYARIVGNIRVSEKVVWNEV